MDYAPGGSQAWQTSDLGWVSAHPMITGATSEFSFSDATPFHTWAAYLDELAHGADGMRQPFRCATPEEAAATHPPLHRRARVAAHRRGRPPLTPSGSSYRAEPRTAGIRP